MSDRPGGDDGSRVQALMDAELRAHFAATPPPSLPPFFAERCARRAVTQASARPLGHRQRLVLRAYWCAAALVSAALILGSRFPPTLPPGLTLALGGIAVVVAFPVMLLARLRGGLFSFLLRVLG